MNNVFERKWCTDIALPSQVTTAKPLKGLWKLHFPPIIIIKTLNDVFMIAIWSLKIISRISFTSRPQKCDTSPGCKVTWWLMVASFHTKALIKAARVWNQYWSFMLTICFNYLPLLLGQENKEIKGDIIVCPVTLWSHQAYFTHLWFVSRSAFLSPSNHLRL